MQGFTTHRNVHISAGLIEPENRTLGVSYVQVRCGDANIQTYFRFSEMRELAALLCRVADDAEREVPTPIDS